MLWRGGARRAYSAPAQLAACLWHWKGDARTPGEWRDLQIRSFAHNEENNVCGYDAVLAHQLHGMFAKDAEGCDRIELAAWKRRGLWQRAQEVLAPLLEDQV